MDKVNTLAWEGRTRTVTGGITEAEAARIHATVGAPGQNAPKDGEILPPLWHWCAFPPTTAMAELGRDGHPMLGDFLPPVPLERRMWASGSLTFKAPMRVGETLKMRSTIATVQEKETGAGPMVVVSVDHQVFSERGLSIEERQNIVYLEIPDTFRPPQKRVLPGTPAFHASQHVNEALLFRFSAITFNAHRIHFDLPYAMDVEHYPGLVIHGPLQAMLLMREAVKFRGERPVHFDFRGVHPSLLVAGEDKDIDLMGTEDDCGALSLFCGQFGHQTMQATAIWEGTQ